MYATSFPFETKAQVFGEYRSARITEKGMVEIKGYYTSSIFFYDDWSSRLLNVLGLQAGIGISERFEFRIRYDRLYETEGEICEGYNMLGITPKYSFLKDKISTLLPLSMSFLDYGSGMWQLQPTVFFSLPMSKKLELNSTIKYFTSLDEETEGGTIVLNWGFAVGNIGEWQLELKPDCYLNQGIVVSFGITALELPELSEK